MNAGPAIRARLAADATLIAMLGTYGGLPCVFYPSVPPDAPRPYVVIDPALAAPVEGQDLSGQEWRAPQHDVSAFVDFTGSAVTIDAIAARVYDLLHANGRSAGQSAALTTSGFNGLLTSVSDGPSIAPTDDSLQGRVVTVRAAMARA